MSSKKVARLFLLSISILVLASTLSAQEVEGIDPAALIERILAVDQKQNEEVKNLVLEAEYVEGENDDEGNFVEKERFIKKIHLKYEDDTVLIHEEYLKYFKDGEEQSEDKLNGEEKDRKEKKKKRKAKDISYPMLTPFYPESAELYTIKYTGVSEDAIEGRVCHHFRVDANEDSPELLKGDYYFEAESFHLVRVDFSPAKLVKKMMFKLHSLEMSITYGPSRDDIWLPIQFDASGRGKAAFFFGVKFAGSEYYRNPIINGGVDDKLFEDNNGK